MEIISTIQKQIDKCKNIYEVNDILEDNLYLWNIGEIIQFTFKNKSYQFWIADSGKSDEPQNGNYPEIRDLKKI